MKRSTVAGVVLFALLVGTNAWWQYRLADVGVSLSYAAQAAAENQEASDQALAVLAARDRSRSEIIEAAGKAAPGSKPFEKEGFVWIGQLGLRFDPNGRLTEVRRSISYK